MTEGTQSEQATNLAKAADVSPLKGLQLTVSKGKTVAPLLAQQLEELSAGIRAYLLLPEMFDHGDLPHTPTAFCPVPEAAGTQAAISTLQRILRDAGLKMLAYQCENAGHLAVNIVQLPGEGTMAVKSVSALRGHTDAVSFPMPGEIDPRHPRIAPAPRVVALAGLRNPRGTPTLVMPLSDILLRLSLEQRRTLGKPHYLAVCQKTFEQGTLQQLGMIHDVFGIAVLDESGPTPMVRYSHEHVIADQLDDEFGERAEREERAAKEALAAFAAAARECAIPVVVNPGDILLINNRAALHGREAPGGGLGAQGRWLLRSYGFDARELRPENYITSQILYP